MGTGTVSACSLFAPVRLGKGKKKDMLLPLSLHYSFRRSNLQAFAQIVQCPRALVPL